MPLPDFRPYYFECVSPYADVPLADAGRLWPLGYAVSPYVLHIQGNTATHLDVRDRAMGMHQAIQHQDPPKIPVKNAHNDQQCPLVRLQPKLAQ